MAVREWYEHVGIPKEQVAACEDKVLSALNEYVHLLTSKERGARFGRGHFDTQVRALTRQALRECEQGR